MASTYNTVVLAERPGRGEIIPGKTFALKTEKLPTESDLKDGEILLEAIYLSLDPAMRGWLNGTCHESRIQEKRNSLMDTPNKLFSNERDTFCSDEMRDHRLISLFVSL
jgi:hypothetical protein